MNHLTTPRKRLTIFLVIFLILNLFVYYLLFTQPDVRTPLILCIMWTPGISGLLAKLISDRTLRGMGWGWGKWRYQGMAYLLPLAACLIVYGAVWTFGWGNFDSTKFTASINRMLFDGEPTFVFWQAFLFVATAWLFMSAISATGEEIGWRGFVVAEVARMMSYTKGAFLIGLFWACWHIPGILYLGYNAGTDPRWAVPCFVVMITSVTFIMNWIRLRSGSLWTGAIFHASHNMFIQAIFDRVTVDSGTTLYVTTEFGIGLALVYATMGFLFWTQRHRLPEQVRVS